MRRHLGMLAAYGALLLLPLVAAAQKPPDEGQRIRLGITTEQQKRLETVLSNGGTQRKAIQDRLHSLYHELHELYETYSFNKQQAQQLQDQIVIEHRKMLTLFAENESKVRDVLTPKQFDKLRAEMRAERERHRREHPPQPGWNGDHPPHPDGPDGPPAQGISQRKG
jgi:Spy/CpxP family protein refolding chaperone